MNELEEITTNKSQDTLIEELSFQLNNGETLGGNICSHIVSQIKKDFILYRFTFFGWTSIEEKMAENIANNKYQRGTGVTDLNYINSRFIGISFKADNNYKLTK